MANRRETVEYALTKLQALIRRPPDDDPQKLVMTVEVPDDLRTGASTTLGLLADERAALEHVRSLMSADLRFEYLKEAELERVTARFVCLARVHQGDLAVEFIAEHAQIPRERTCFFPVELLTVKQEVELYGVTFIPLDAVERPPTVFGHEPTPATRSVIGVVCTGTDYGKMSTRGRAVAERALRLLRATLREERWLPDGQLRFRLGSVVWFDNSVRAGWTMPREEGWELELDAGLLRHATSQQISTLPDPPTNDVERRVELALTWFERGQLAVDPVVELLYLFFALEAILGDKSEGLKASALAVRRAMLGLLTSGRFVHPSRTYLLYDEVRSSAVHGEEPPAISQRDVNLFAWDVRLALNEFIAYARAEGFTRRAQVRKALDGHERRQRVVRGLLRDDPKLWRPLLERRPASAATRDQGRRV